MEFFPFYTKFPKIALQERYIIKVKNDPDGLPDGEYMAIELYCSEGGCDCHKVMINMFSVAQQKILATIGYGWESSAFYCKWMHGDRELAKMMKGVYVELGGIQSEHTVFFLKKIKELITNNLEFTIMIKQHYTLFKEKASK